MFGSLMKASGNRRAEILLASLGIAVAVVVTALLTTKNRARAQGHAGHKDRVHDDKRPDNREHRAPANPSPAPTLSGRCVHAATGEPIASVNLIVNGGPAAHASGTGFEILCPASGPASLHVQAPGFDDMLVIWKPGMTRALGDIVLLPNLKLGGRVVTPDGKPAARARLVLLRRRDRDWTVFQTCETTVDGGFSVPLRRGTREWRVLASLAGVGIATVTLSAPTDSVLIRLGAGHALKGVVRSSRSGRPVEGVRVLLQTRGKRDSKQLAELTQTDQSGEFTVDHVDLTHTSLAFDKPGFALSIARAGTPTRLLEVELSPAREVTGNVVDVDKGPVGDALARVGVSRDFLVPDVRTDPSGRFVVSRVPDVRGLRVAASRGLAHGDAALGAGSVTITVKQPDYVTAGTVTVVDASGTPLPGVRVVLRHGSGREISQVTGPQGTAAFRFHPKSTARGMLVATGKGLVAIAKEPITLPHWPEGTVLVVKPGVLLTGRVVVPPTATSAALRVVARLAGDFPAVVGRTWADHTGAFLMTVPRGRRLAIPIRVVGATPTLVLKDVNQPRTDLGDVVLQPGVTLRGSVQNEKGKRLGSITVRCLKPGWSQYFNRFATLTQNDGSFILKDVPPPPFVLNAIDRRGEVKQEHDGSVTEYQLTLPRR